MKTAFLILATILTIYSVVPYIRDILRGTTKPNLVSWITWTILTSIATAAEIAAHEYVAAIFTASAVVETGLVVAVGLMKKAYVKYSRFDVVCQVSAIVGIVLWQIFDSPAIGVLASVAIDLVGALPTLLHSWRDPEEETWQTFALAGLGGCAGLIALETYNMVSLPYATYLIIINAAMAAIIIYRKQIPKPKRFGRQAS